MEEPIYNLKSFKNPRDRRLANEHLSLHELCTKTDRITYEVISMRKHPPEEYLITYKLKSIVGIDEQKNPIYGYEHQLEVSFPADYPASTVAKCYMRTPVWHPNIKHDGRFKGRVCVNAKEFGKLFFLDDLVIRVGQILQYQNYHAKNEQPFPEDEKVAQWVRDFAEPQDIVNKDKQIFVDGTSLLGPLPEAFQQPEEAAPEAAPEEPATGSQIKIKSTKSKPSSEGGKKININIRNKSE